MSDTLDGTEEPLDECEVCSGRHGPPVCTVTFSPDDDDTVLPVRMCQTCIGAVYAAMSTQWNDAVAAHNAEVDAWMRLLGIESPF